MKDEHMAKNSNGSKVTRGMDSANTKATSGRYVQANKSAKSSAASALTQRAAKAGRFADGVKLTGNRYKSGLIKLADR